MTRENNRGRHEIRVLDCWDASPQQVGFPGVQTIARLWRRVRRKARRAPKVTVTREGVSLCQKGVTPWLLFLIN